MKRKMVIYLIFGIVLIIACSAWFFMHEKTQNANIVALIEEKEAIYRKLEALTEKTELLTRAAEELSQRDDRNPGEPLEWGDGYNWMAIGNSLTWVDSWEHGICSTQPDNDYFGIVKKWLEERYDTVQAERCNYSNWEQSILKSSMFDRIKPYLSEKLDLVTIQLGENVSSLDTYGKELRLLITYIRKFCPEARIILIDDFWSQERSDIRRTVAEEAGIEFADLGEIRGKDEYQSKEGIECILKNGSTRIVEKADETHPGDAGMAYIADQLIKILE